MLALLSLFALGILIFVHELGHLLAARVLGIRATHVVFGFGPALYTARRKGLRFTLGAVPLGGTVELEGENPHRVEPPAKATTGYSAQPPLKRLLVLLGGPLTNFLLAPALLFALYLHGTHVAVPLTVGSVVPGSEAAFAQLRPGDRILAVAGAPLTSWTQLTQRVSESVGRPLALTLERPTGAVTVRVTPALDDKGVARVGLTQQYVFRALPFREALAAAFGHAGWLVTHEMLAGAKLIKGAEEVRLSEAGHLVHAASESAAAGGLDAVLRTLAGLSVALGLFYLIPIPALDGGRTLLVLWELFTKRRLDPRLLTALQTVGLVAVLALLAWVVWTHFQHFTIFRR